MKWRGRWYFIKPWKKIFPDLFSTWKKCVSLNCGNFCRTTRMCGHECEPALRCPQMVRIPFAVNQNLLVFCVNTKRTGCARCPFHTPGVLCSPQVHKKLINRVPNTRRTRMVQRVSGALVYTRFYTRNEYNLNIFMLYNFLGENIIFRENCKKLFLGCIWPFFRERRLLRQKINITFFITN